MAWSSLATRLSAKPLVICGPILRKTTADEVSVWIALQSSQTSLTLKVYNGTTIVAQGTISTTTLGTNLHVAVITALKTGASLSAGITYTYDIEFGSSSTTLASNNILENGTGSLASIVFSNSGNSLPSFSLPPTNMSDLRLIHASCRKAHGQNNDALEGLYHMINDTFQNNPNSTIQANKRPHQLFLTGDQIYADDVADSLLHMLMDASTTLLGWTEQLPVTTPPTPPYPLSDLFPGKRSSLIKDYAMLTPEAFACKSHLVTLGEFYCMYLFAFSPVLWDSVLPNETQIEVAGGSVSGSFDDEQKGLAFFLAALPNVRRALANVPVYMIMDDHDITDDWNINGTWVNNVYGSDLGKRIISNGLAAYAVFQHWGNVPAYFSSGNGAALLNCLTPVSNPPTPNFNAVASLVLPDPDGSGISLTHLRRPSYQSNSGFTWNYQIIMPNYEVIVLDCRTLRAFPGGLQDYAELISRIEMSNQIPVLSNPSIEISIVIIPSPLFDVPLMERAKNAGLKSQRSFLYRDKEDWQFRENDSVQYMMHCLAKNRSNAQQQCKILLLAGDVHFAYTSRVQLWARELLDPSNPTTANYATTNSPNYNMVVAHLTASSLKNEEKNKTTLLHHIGYRPILEVCRYQGQKFGYQVNNNTSPPPPLLRKIGTSQYRPWISRFNLTRHPTVLSSQDFSGVFTSGGSVIPESPITLEPDWKYRVDYLKGTLNSVLRPQGNVVPLQTLNTSTVDTKLADAGTVAENYKQYASLHGNGREIVGVNNIGDIVFAWSSIDANRLITHNLWWCIYSETSNPARIDPRTSYEIPMGYTDPNFQEPTKPYIISHVYQFSEKLLGEVKELIEPITIALSSPEQCREFFTNIGWDLDNINSGSVNNLQTMLGNINTAFATF